MKRSSKRTKKSNRAVKNREEETVPANSGSEKPPPPSLEPALPASFWKRVWTGLKPVIQFTFVLVVFLILVSSGTYQDTERKISDLKTYVNSLPDEKDQVVIVAIENQDYEEIFGSKSPLDPAKLGELIAAIAKFRPKVIGVDIFTHDESFRNIDTGDLNVPIVWARDAVRNPEREIILVDRMVSGFSPALGGRELPAGNWAAPTLLPVDSDGKVRQYQSIFEAKDGIYLCFSEVVSQISKTGGVDQAAAPSGNRYIRFAGATDRKQISYRPKFTAAAMLSLAPDAEIGEMLRNKIVLIGGYYEENKAAYAIDTVKTPLGTVYGADVVASVIETKNLGGGDRPVGLFARVTLNILVMIVMMVLFHYFSFWKAMLFTLTGGAGLSTAIILLFGNALVLPAILFILLLKVTDKAKSYSKDYMRDYLGRVIKLSKEK